MPQRSSVRNRTQAPWMCKEPLFAVTRRGWVVPNYYNAKNKCNLVCGLKDMISRIISIPSTVLFFYFISFTLLSSTF